MKVEDLLARLEEAAVAGIGLDELVAELSEAVWSATMINNLADSSFLYIEPGGEKDEEGKTVPRSKRHFPVYDDVGKLDLPHLRNSLQRIPQSTLDQGAKDKALAKAQKLAKQHLPSYQEADEIVGDLNPLVETLELQEVEPLVGADS